MCNLVNYAYKRKVDYNSIANFFRNSTSNIDCAHIQSLMYIKSCTNMY